jgi:gamma-glutamylcyclotransferase (GGCT)/AIG2-like uncharacterized protein YtfP
MRPAAVDGYRVVGTDGGYLAALPLAGAAAFGALVELDAAGYAIADAWEDRSVYDRIEVAARCGERMERCFIYVYARPVSAGVPVADGRLSDRTRAEVIRDIRRFRASADFPRSP